MKRTAFALAIWSMFFHTVFSQDQTDIFNIYFSHNFENNTLGTYLRSEWEKDWNYPWSKSYDTIKHPLTILQNQDPDQGTKVLRFIFSKGSYSGVSLPAGAYWDCRLGRSFDEIYFSYRIKFREGFDWVHGGKIPALRCSDAWDGWRGPPYELGGANLLMWHEKPTIVDYYYYYGQTHDYGATHLWDATIESGKWFTLTLRVVMNTISGDYGNKDAIFEGYINGRLVSQLTGFTLRNLPHIGVDRLVIETFFGGSSDFFAATRDEYIEVDDFFVFTYKDNVDVPRGNEMSPQGRILILPDGSQSYDITADVTPPESTPEPEPLPTSPYISIKAFGTEVAGENAHFNLLVNGDLIGETFVTSSSKNYVFSLNRESGPNDTVIIHFDNDYFSQTLGDRNLFIESIDVDGNQYDPSSKNVIFIQDVSGNVLSGTGGLYYPGKLIFFLGESEVNLSDFVTVPANNSPTVSSSVFYVADSSLSGSYVGSIDADDPDTEQQLTYAILSGNEDNTFAINSSNGSISLNESGNLVSKDQFDILVKVSDDHTEKKSDSAYITINVVHIQVQDTVIAVTSAPSINNQQFSLKGPVQSDTRVGLVQASHPNSDVNILYQITSGNSEKLFSINSTTGELKFAKEKNITDTTTFNITVTALLQDMEHLSSPAQITITVIPAEMVVYIDPTNINDDMRDGTLEHPFSSWKEVTWNPDFAYLQKKGTISNEGKINIYSENVVIGSYGEGDLPVVTSSAKDYAIRAFEKSNITIRDIHIVANEAISCIYFLGSSSDNNMIENCILEGANSGIRIVDGKTYTIQYTTIKGTVDAIYSFAATNNIYYNIFKENHTAININSYVSSADVFNNVFYGNTSGVTTTYSELTLYNNIFYLVSAGDQAINHSMDKLVSDNNIFYPERQGFISINNVQYKSISELQSSLNIDLNSFSQDPEFIDIYNDNFMVNEQSPAIDAGIYVGITSDFYGQVVPHGNQPDIGLTELKTTKIISALPSTISERDEEPSIYPNPSDGRFNIYLDNKNGSTANLMVTDMTGKVIYQSFLDFFATSTVNIDLSEMPDGVYLVLLQTDLKVFTQQIIIR